MSAPPLTSGPRISESDALLVRRLVLGLVIPGGALTTILLIIYAYAAWHPVSRSHLDRVSFRLLVYALLAHLIFCIAFPLSTMHPRPGVDCSLRAFFTNSSVMFSAGMFFCVAINIPLVLSEKVDGQRMEKFYVAGVAAVCLACNITPLAAGQLGLNPGTFTCGYIAAPGPTLLKWVLSTETFWILSASVGEVTSFVAILVILGHRLQTRLFRIRAGTSMFRTHRSDIETTFPSVDLDINTQDSKPPTENFARTSRQDRERIRSTRVLRSIVLRIGLYPLVSCLLNISTSAIDWHLSDHHPLSAKNRKLTLADLAIYSSRPLLYGLLAATDPSFLRAMHALCGSDDSSPSGPTRTDTARGGERRTTWVWPGPAYPSTIVDISYESSGLYECEMDVLANTSTTAEVGRRKPEAEEEGPRRVEVGRSLEEASGADVNVEAADREAMGWLVSQI
ncbi:hypothetical protein C8F01DRAFT_1184026 [Mycena amicta]|nr:hypothetical protein C8F01DRAFT_1184026 [Mycena amicta]